MKPNATTADTATTNIARRATGTSRSTRHAFIANSPHGSAQRRQALAQVLAQRGGTDSPGSKLDIGGGGGTLIAELDGAEPLVLNPSGTPPVADVDRMSDAACTERQWDLIVCARVLKHLADQRQTVDQLDSLLAPEGRLYLEVPDEVSDSRTYAGPGRDRLQGRLVTGPALLVTGDIISTACRIKLGTLPPFGFIPMREYLQYFTEDSLRAIINACRLHVVLSGRNPVCQIYALAVRRPHSVA